MAEEQKPDPVDPRDHARVVELLKEARDRIAELEKQSELQREQSRRELDRSERTLKLREGEVSRLQKVEDELKEVLAENEKVKAENGELKVSINEALQDLGRIWDRFGGDDSEREARLAAMQRDRDRLDRELAKMAKRG